MPAGEVAWEKVAPLDALMQQVPIVNNAMRRGLEPNRLKKGAQQTAGHAATLAAIAQAASLDLSATDDESAEDWRKLCRQMLDAAGQINSAVHGGDAAAVQAGAKQLVQECEACHRQFRDGK